MLLYTQKDKDTPRQATRPERKSLMNELRMNIKMMILSYEEALHNNEAMFSAEESGFRARADKLATEIYPEFDAEFYHRYADNADWPDDEDEEEFFDDCRMAYCSAVSKLDSVGMNIDEITSRYNNARREIILNRDEYVIKAFRSVPDEFWIGEDWESEFRSIYFSSIYNG